MEEPVRSYHARRGRLSATARRSLADLSGALDLQGRPGPINLDAEFGRKAPRVLEIGSGLGDTALFLAESRPQVDVIAADVHTKGIARTMQTARRLGLANLRVLHGDALDFLRTGCRPGALTEILVLFPDPWPKARHQKRRLVRDEFAELAARTLTPGGLLHLATDDDAYAEVMRRVLAGSLGFVSVDAEPAARQRPVTKYELRGLDLGHTITDLVYVRRSSGS